MSIIKTEHAPTHKLRNIDNLVRFSHSQTIFFSLPLSVSPSSSLVDMYIRGGEKKKKAQRKIFLFCSKEAVCTHLSNACMYVYT